MAPLAAALLLLPAAVHGQQIGPPVPLFPPSPTSPGEPPARKGGHLVEPLSGWSGEVAAPAAALPRDLWRGTPRALADLLLARLPDTASPALQGLVRRLLLSPATAPEGADLPGRALPLLRAAALLRLGEIDAARAVIAAIPEPDRGPALPLAVDADVIAGDIDHACAIVHERIHRDQDVSWQTALIGCQALQGQVDQASLGLQLLDEEKAPHDEALRIAVRALSGGPAPAGIERLKSPDPLALRLLVAAKRELSAGLVDALPADLALTLARDAATPPATRLAAAERAACLGALPAARLRAVYDELSGEAAPEDARLFAMIARAGTAAERLSRIIAFADALSRRQAGGLFVAARLVAPLLHEIEPDPSLGGSAAAVARLLLSAGDSDLSRRWSTLVAGPDGAALGFLLQLAGGRGEAGEPGVAHGAMALALSEAVGDPLAAADWTRLPAAAWDDPGRAPPPAAWLDLVDAARQQRVGETVLAAVLVAAPAGKPASEPVALHAAIASLGRVGLGAEARRLAVEAALAARL